SPGLDDDRVVALHLVALLVLDVALQDLGVVLVEDVEHAPGGPGGVVVVLAFLVCAVDALHDVLDRGWFFAWPLAPVASLDDRAFLGGWVLLEERLPVARAKGDALLLQCFERFLLRPQRLSRRTPHLVVLLSDRR